MKPSVCILTAYNSVLHPLATFTVPRMHAFAQAHGYEVRIIHRDDWERQRGWIKIEAVRAALDSNFNFVFWIDVDAVIVRCNVDVRIAAVDGADLHMVWQGPPNTSILQDNFVPRFNSGIMLIRVTDWSRDFFKRTWEVGQLSGTIVDHWSDQATILHLLGYDNILALGSERPDEPNRARVAHLEGAWNVVPGITMTPDPIIHHYAGAGDPGARLKLIEVDAKTVALREGASSELRQAFFWQLSQWCEDVRMHSAMAASRSKIAVSRDAAIAERNAARSEVLALRTSNSWKLTAPLRRASAFLRHPRRLPRHCLTLLRLGIKSPRRLLRTQAEIEAIAASGLFNITWYLEHNDDVRRARIDPVLHYLLFGGAEGRDPNPLFDGDWYLQNNSDVRAAGINPLLHYLRHGAAEGRDPHPLFDSGWYLANNPDVSAAGINPLSHYLQYGAHERRPPNSGTLRNRFVHQNVPPFRPSAHASVEKLSFTLPGRIWGTKGFEFWTFLSLLLIAANCSRILELGSGRSTITLAEYAKFRKARFTSIETNREWFNKARLELRCLDLSDEPVHLSDRDHESGWYQLQQFRAVTRHEDAFDFIFIDGPNEAEGNSSGIRDNSIGLSEIRACSPNADVVLIDDVHRRHIFGSIDEMLYDPKQYDKWFYDYQLSKTLNSLCICIKKESQASRQLPEIQKIIGINLYTGFNRESCRED